MVVYTKDHARVGQTFYIPTVAKLVPDPQGEFFDDEGTYSEETLAGPEYKTLKGAWSWVQRQKGWSNGDISSSSWSEYTFHDDVYGVVKDADVEWDYVAYAYFDGEKWVKEDA